MKNTNKKPNSFIEQPTYPGGSKALNEFISENLKYPQEAFDNNIQGTVSVDFDIDVFGKVILTKIKHGIGYGCDEEAARLIKLLHFSKRKYQGIHVIFHRNLNITFRINTAVKPPEPGTSSELKINYSTPDQKDSKSNTYTITVNLDSNTPKT